MKKILPLALCIIVTVTLTIILNKKVGPLPPMGALLNPFTGFWQNAEDAKGFKDENWKLEGLKEEVEVYFDERLVPHVFAKNDEDLYYMQGYITARFRLWQMEVQTHNAAGRVSEFAGSKALESDRMQRRIGLEYGAQAAQEYIAQDPESKKLLDAYCNGVNAYIKSLTPADYPLEYKLLDYKPEEWTPIKVALLLKNMANMLSVFEYDIESSNFVAAYGKNEFNKLYPEFIADEDPIIPVGTTWNARKTDSTKMANTGSASNGMYANVIQKPDEITGSNNWAVSGSKTKSGKPILCNDPHLRLSLPSIWYEMHLVSPTMNAYGATLPGSPAIIIGFNDSISWGVTNGGRDVRDWYKIQFKDETCNEYMLDGKWEKTTKKVEKFIVRDTTPVYDTVLYTKFGPVVFDKTFGNADSKKYLSMKWTAHLPSNEFKTFYGFNTGKNYDDYLAALTHYACPAQNFVFASRSGDIAIKEQGKFAVLNKEQGKFISDGTTLQSDWHTFIPTEDNPTIKNPARGFVSSANQHPTDTTYPYYYSGLGVYENYRNRRINKLLSEGTGIDVAFMQKMQVDNYNLHAKEILPVLLSLLDNGKIDQKEQGMITALSKWNYFNDANQVAPIYFEIWWNELRKLLWDEMLNPAVPMKQPSFYVTAQFLAHDSTSAFYDNKTTKAKENRRDIVLLAFKRITDTLNNKEFTEVEEPYGRDETTKQDNINTIDWGKYKATKVNHLASIQPFSSLGVYNGGNLGIINATNTTSGPSWRMIVDEGAMQAFVVYPGGESGNPGSKFYDNMISTWADGKYYQANFVKSGEELGANKLFKATFKPAGK